MTEPNPEIDQEELEIDFDEMETDALVEVVNALARKGSTPELPSDFLDQNYEQAHYNLVDSLYSRLSEQQSTLRQETSVSDFESLVVALKGIGITHNGISLLTSLDSEGAAKSTIDEYSRRARQKYLQAKRTVSLLEDIYGGDSE